LTTERVGKRSARHQTTSVRSPNVQIMAIAEPFSGSATVGLDLNSKSNSGVRTVERKRSGSARSQDGDEENEAG